jgi:hypothetical protein
VLNFPALKKRREALETRSATGPEGDFKECIKIRHLQNPEKPKTV